jgi:hypothetical protein
MIASGMQPFPETFVIDAIEDGVARLEGDDRFSTLPAALLPETAREGDLLTLQRFANGSGDAIAWVLRIDAAARQERERALLERRERLPVAPDGDLTL